MKYVTGALLFVLCLASSTAATKYVDNSLATGSNDGTSWANAWHSLSGMTGLSAGDVVQISGGSTGNTQTYSFSDVFPASLGSSGTHITYEIGQDSAHNGTAIFNQTSVGFSNGNFLYGGHDVTFSGDAGDGAKHFKLSGTFTGLVVLQGSDHDVRMSYFDLGTFPGIGSINPGTHVEVDHINIKVGNYAAVDRAIYFNIGGSTWDDSSIHDCTILLPYNPTNSNFGPDGIQPGGSGYSIYDNTIDTYVDNSLTTTQHMDGIQTAGGSYIKAYRNHINNMTNYGMYWESSVAVHNHLWVWDNVVSVTDPVLATNSSGGIVVEQKVAGTMNDIVVVHNTIIDLQPPGSRALTMLSDGHGAYTNSVLKNNLLVNASAPETDVGAPTPSNNVNVTETNGHTYFTSYVKYGGLTNDFHLTSSATSVIHTGADLSAYVTTDASGVTFANPGPSVGAYELTGTPVVSPPVARIRRNIFSN